MTPEQQKQIRNTIRTLEELGYDRDEIIGMTAGETKASKDEVAAVYDEVFPQVIQEQQPETIVHPTPEAIRFISKHFEPEDVVCVVLIDPTKKTGGTRNIFTRPSDIDDEFIKSLHKENQTQNVYLGMNAYNPILLGGQNIAEVNKHGRTEDNVVTVRNLYADADHDGAAVLEKIRTSTIVPSDISTVLESSPGKFNIIWSVQNILKDEAKPILKALAQEFNTDPNVTDLARILRIPGFQNVKYETKPIVRIASESDRKYSRADFKLNLTEEKKPEERPAAGNWEEELKTQLAGPDINEHNPGRNKTLTSILGRFRQVYGLAPEHLYEIGSQINDQRCKPSLPESEVKTIANSVGGYEVKDNTPTPVIMGGQVLGQQDVAANASNNAQSSGSNWRSLFRTIGEMEQGEPGMIIEGVLQEEGICGIGALPGSGKTLVALAFAKAICLGEPLFGIPEYIVKKPRNVIYLIPESSDRPFRMRCEAFGLPDDERFRARTISMGVPLQLQDPGLIEAVKELRPVVVLDTMRRFTYSTDENAAAQNKMFFNHALNLRAEGALSVIVNHHAIKASGKQEMTLENMFAGTGDIGAMFDEAYGIRADKNLYDRGAGPLQIELVNLKDREMHGGLTRLKLAATYKKPGKIFPVSYINETGNFHVMTSAQEIGQMEDVLVNLVSENPNLSRAELTEQTRLGRDRITRLLGNRGWHSVPGGKSGHSPWHQDNGKPCPYEKAKRGGINLDGKAA